MLSTSNFPHDATSHLPPLLAVPLPLVLPLLPLLSGWLMRRLFPRHRVPCQSLLLHPRLSFLRSRASCLAGCRIDSHHTAVSHLSAPSPGGLGPGSGSLGAKAFSSHRAVASCSAALAPFIWLVVVSPLLTPLHSLPGPPPLAAPSPLFLPLSRLVVASPSTPSANPSSTNTPQARCS